MTYAFRTLGVIAILPAFALGACGGASGEGVALAPPPPPPAQPSKAFVPMMALDTSQSLTVVGENGSDAGVSVRYDAAAGVYLVALPQGEQGAFFAEGPSNGYWSGQLVDPSNTSSVSNEFFGYKQQEGAHFSGIAYATSGDTFVTVALGLATPEGAVPVTGSATYELQLDGDLGGSGEMRVDFGAGALEGWVVPVYSDAWYAFELGTYQFIDMVYGAGDTRFSGGLRNDSTAMGGSIAGLFAGPAAEEAIGHLTIDYPSVYGEGTETGTSVFSGVQR